MAINCMERWDRNIDKLQILNNIKYLLWGLRISYIHCWITDDGSQSYIPLKAKQDKSPLLFFTIHHVIEILKARLGWLTRTTLPSLSLIHTSNLFWSEICHQFDFWRSAGLWKTWRHKNLISCLISSFRQASFCSSILPNLSLPTHDTKHLAHRFFMIWDHGYNPFLYSIKLSKQSQNVDRCRGGLFFPFSRFLSLLEPPLHSQVSLANRCCW